MVRVGIGNHIAFLRRSCYYQDAAFLKGCFAMLFHDANAPVPEAAPLVLPTGLPLLRARLSLRLLAEARLPAYKGGMFRGGFGYAFQRATCPQPCWGHTDQCPHELICPYRWVFEAPRPSGVEKLHDLQDVPRPFVLDLPADRRTQYRAGEVLEVELTVIGRGIDYLPYFIFGFGQFAQAGLGAQRAPARLERVEALNPWQPVGTVIYQDGRMLPDVPLPLLDGAQIATRAAALPNDLRITLTSPTRIKAQGTFLTTLDLPALVRGVCWRIYALALFHGEAWWYEYRGLVERARAVTVEQAQFRWEEWERESRERRRMELGGIVGSALLRNVDADLRTILLAGSLVHVGKACVFGHGAYQLSAEKA
jgi:hypothetical protein